MTIDSLLVTLLDAGASLDKVGPLLFAVGQASLGCRCPECGETDAIETNGRAMLCLACEYQADFDDAADDMARANGFYDLADEHGVEVTF